MPDGGRALLGELARLGLVRIARNNGDDRFHVLTSLGEQMLGGSLGGDAGVVAHMAELERLRTDLLSTIAHELRTPLTAIRTCVGVLRDPETTPSDVELDTLLGTIERNADRMQRVVGDILEIARFRTGEVVLQLRRFDAVELARGAVASLAPLATQGQQQIDLDVSTSPIRVYGDHRRLEQALVNLVSNAVKYSPVGCRILASRSGSRLRGDLGGPRRRPRHPAGRATPPLRALLRRSQRSRPGRRAAWASACRSALAIAQAHGGRIDVVSVPGEGSLFSLVVPTDGPPDDD